MTAPGDEHGFETLLQYLKRVRGFDFTGYKRASLARRIAKRMQTVDAPSFAAYMALLDQREDEFGQLVNTILINVTSFFRDPAVWDFLQTDVVPRLLEDKPQDAPMRLWSAGCATGEETYSLAILLAEVMGPDAVRDRVKVYGTDADEEALAVARVGSYSERSLAAVRPEWRDKYFDRSDTRFAFRRDLRRSVIFGRNDLTRDVPISRLDMIVCRNTLMYFDAQTQAHVIARFHFALNAGGTLVLGRAETLLTQTPSFTPLDIKRRIFAKVARTRPLGAPATPPVVQPMHDSSATAVLRAAASDVAPVAQIVVDRAGTLLAANERARIMFRLAEADLGRPLQDLEISYRPVELRSCLDRAYADRQTVTVRGVEWRIAGEQRWLDLELVPILVAGAPAGASASFTDVTSNRQLRADLEQSQQELVGAYEELQSSNEELETTNEELQSTVEELETTNEELQSTNEELETMNEELQSTNEELQTLNDESNHRGDELAELNRFLESIFASLRAGVAVLDRDLRVLVWNPRAEDLWGLRQDEVLHAHFLALDIGLPLDRIRAPLRETVSDGQEVREVVVPATNRRGRAIDCRVTLVPLVARNGDVSGGAILLMEELAPAS